MKEKKNTKKRKPIILIFILLIIFVVEIIAFTFITSKTLNAVALLKALKNGLVYVIFAVIVGALIIYTLVNWRINDKKSVMKESDLSDSHWLSEKEIKKTSELTVTSFGKLHTLNDGLPLKAEIRRNRNKVIYRNEPIHAIVVGTTGSGKTSGFLDPTIQIMATFKTKPCIIVTDPKGELHRHHSSYLKEKGYKVSVIDYRYPYQSTKVNPFQSVIDRIKQLNLTIKNEKGKYVFDNKTYLKYTEAEKALAERRQELNDEIYENLQDIIYTLFPIKDEKEPGWEEGARNLIFGMCLLFVDDILAGEMPIEKFCLINVYENLAKYCDEEMDVMKAYFERHKDNVKAYGLAKTVLVTSERTLTSYLSKVMNYVQFLADGGIQCITSDNEISFEKFDEEPNAVFLVFPDEKDNRHVMVSTFLVQAYKSLVNRAALNLRQGLTEKEELQRNCYFLMDEFGNLPKIPKFDAMTTVGRSRRLFFICVVQSYQQLEKIYGKTEAETIKGQLQIKIYLGTDDKPTVEEFSWLCGKKKITTLSANVSLEKDGSGTYSAKEQPLVSIEELMTLNNKDTRGNAIVKAYGLYPMKTVFTPSFQAKHLYKIGDEANELREAGIFEKDRFVYDIKRDSVVFGIDEGDELSQEDIEELEEIQAEQQSEKEKLNNLDMKWKGLKSSIKAKLDLIREFIPEALYSALLKNKKGEQGKMIDKCLSNDETLSLVRYELVYIKKLFARLVEVEEEIRKVLKEAQLEDKEEAVISQLHNEML